MIFVLKQSNFGDNDMTMEYYEDMEEEEVIHSLQVDGYTVVNPGMFLDGPYLEDVPKRQAVVIKGSACKLYLTEEK
jgi:allophanate hydrolase subunit 1